MALCALTIQAQAQTPAQKGASYLLSKQGADGSFGGATGTEPVITTFEAIRGLSTVVGSEAEQVMAALTFLHGQTPVETDLQARRLQALEGTLLADSLAAQVLASALQPQVVVDGNTLGIANITGDGLYPGDVQSSALDTAETLAFLAAQA